MRHTILSLGLALLSICAQAVTPIVYNGDSLSINSDFKRLQCGSSPAKMVEISGLSCSRVTPGYLWAQSDDNYRVVAITEKGAIQYDILLRDRPSRSDWEDMCSGVWQGRQTLFIGGFGDNNLRHADDNYIFYMDEPTIPSVACKDTFYVGQQYILFGYPDSVAHDAEAMFFDNQEQVMYIIDKVDNTCATVFSLRMDTVYGNDLQRLTRVCQLGLPGEWQFMRVTAADITPDGRWIIIKNYDVYHEKAYALLWERQDGESVSQTLLRQPEQIAAYLLEWQGEAVAWLDSTTFYTTSDEDGSAPIFKYVRWDAASLDEIAESRRDPASVVMMGGHLYIRSKDDSLYSITGQAVR